MTTARAHAQHIVQYTPTTAILDDYATYTYLPEDDYDRRTTLPKPGTVVEIIESTERYARSAVGNREIVTIADARTGKRYGTVSRCTLFVHQRRV